MKRLKNTAKLLPRFLIFSIFASVAAPVIGQTMTTAPVQPASIQPAALTPAEAINSGFDFLRSLNLSLAESFDSFESSPNPYSYDKNGNLTDINFDPASFDLTHTPGSPVAYNSQFLLAWRPLGDKVGRFAGGQWSPLVSFEGNISQDDSASTDAMHGRFTVNGLYASANPSFAGLGQTGFKLVSSAEYEANREFTSQKIVGSIRIQPIAFALGMGRRVPAIPLGANGHADPNGTWWPQFNFDPYIGIAAGQTLDQPAGSLENRTVLRPLAGAVVHIHLDRVGKLLNLYGLNFSIQDDLVVLPLQDGITFNYFNAGVHFMLTKDASFNVTYEIGRQSPTFDKIEKLDVGVGLRF